MTATYQAQTIQWRRPPSCRLFAIVGVALYGLPFFYDFMVRDFGWTRQRGDVRQRLQQADRRPALRLPRRLDGRPLRPATPDDRRHPHGRPRAGRPRRRLDHRRSSTSSICSTRSATSAAARCPIRCCSPAGSTAHAAARWASPISASASAARSCRCSRRADRQVGWHTALQILGALIIVVALPFALFVRDTPDTAAQAAPDAPAREHTPGHRATRQRVGTASPRPLRSGASSRTGHSPSSSSAACARSARSAGRCRT